MPNQEPMIKVQDVRFRYDPEQPKYAVDGVSLDIRRGEFVAVLGANGCGKSTLAKHFNTILLPEAGTVLVEGMDTRNEDHLYDVRQKVGMVFQNPRQPDRGDHRRGGRSLCAGEPRRAARGDPHPHRRGHEAGGHL